jgi:hypothetical protein
VPKADAAARPMGLSGGSRAARSVGTIVAGLVLQAGKVEAAGAHRVASSIVGRWISVAR